MGADKASGRHLGRRHGRGFPGRRGQGDGRAEWHNPAAISGTAVSQWEDILGRLDILRDDFAIGPDEAIPVPSMDPVLHQGPNRLLVKELMASGGRAS